ncbi:bifunctional RNase H/acid phosphatase [Sphaerisporangium rufum]|uniref:Bifunctional RNase H/acid phosphatase n=1 Tax=Sphaerisporangium rufum TaxID=1381558 RepID=A0A919QYC7_9ACTN|nr:bifunctional RNase H/acid phosphatase [Sphaerisporangium rufum]GII76371.1 bifunctional RNase H/acid phosphatase [Sphaerisporangium rufum]
MSLVVEADGGSRGNPGPAGYGAVVKDADGQVLAEAADALGVTTNNVAEYQGLIAGLRSALAIGGDGATVEVRMDSKLVIEQMAGRWKIKNEGLRPLARQADELARRLRVRWTWVPRERNRDADRLANAAMDAAARGEKWQPAGLPEPSPPPAAAAPEPALAREPSASPQDRSGGWMGPATTATTLLLLRHGETPLSVERRFSGTGDPELTPKGVAQAEAAAARLARPPYRIDVIVSSPLRRALATAEAVAGRAGLKVAVDEDLREVAFGEWEGHTFTEIQRRWPGELAAWLADPSVAPPGGESFEQAASRIEQARERLLLDHRGKTVLAVSHVTPIKLFLRFALLAPAASLYRMHLDIGSLCAIDYFPDGPELVRAFNDTAHLR